MDVSDETDSDGKANRRRNGNRGIRGGASHTRLVRRGSDSGHGGYGRGIRHKLSERIGESLAREHRSRRGVTALKRVS